MAKLTFAKTFLDDYGRMPKPEQKRLRTLIGLFESLSAIELTRHKGIHLEPYAGSADPRSRTVRVTDNHRGIVMDAGDENFVLVRVLTHDDADRWMANNTFGVNAATGAVEFVDIPTFAGTARQLTAVDSSSATDTSGTESVGVDGSEPETAPASLFAHRSDDEFGTVGVADDLVAMLRAFTHQDQLQGAIGLLPPLQAEAVIELTGDANAADILDELTGGEGPPERTDDVVAALDSAASKRSFRLVEDEEELAEALTRPWDTWKTFLHPAQRRLAERLGYNGPVRATGGAGTGKTVVAIHRARALAYEYADSPGTPVLLTTFTRNLAQEIDKNLRSLDAEAAELVEVSNIDKVAYGIVADVEGAKPAVLSTAALKRTWGEALQATGLDDDYTAAFLEQEWDRVILANDCTDRAAYFRVSRAGRGTPLARRARAEVWRVVEEFTRLTRAAGARTHLQLAADAARYVERRSTKPYRSVVVDEAQDFHENQWRLVRALVARAPDDLFLAGDSHQRIYDRKSSLKQLGIDIVGRSYKLKLNYRTTYEIMRWGLSVLGTHRFDDLDGGFEDHSPAGYHSLRSGPVPTMAGHSDETAQYAALVERIRGWVDDDVALEEIGVAARTKAAVDAVGDALQAADITVCRLPKKDLPKHAGVRIGTMHRMKGLEFRAVAVVGADDESVPLRWAIDEPDRTARADALIRERCLLYVAGTRARDELHVCWTGAPSRFLAVSSGAADAEGLGGQV